MDSEKANAIDYAAGAGAEFAASFKYADPPYQQNIIITCIDPRVNTFVNAVAPGAVVSRNAGGSAKAALRDIIIAQELSARDIAIFHHTDCNMCRFRAPSLREKLIADNAGDAAVARAVEGLDLVIEIDKDDLEESVREDVRYLKGHPLVKKDAKVTGWVYDIKTGKATQIV